MGYKVRKWGNSLGVRIPKALADHLQVRDGAAVDMSVEAGRLVIKPRRSRTYSLSALMDKVSAGNIHGEIDSGPARGRELL